MAKVQGKKTAAGARKSVASKVAAGVKKAVTSVTKRVDNRKSPAKAAAPAKTTSKPAPKAAKPAAKPAGKSAKTVAKPAPKATKSAPPPAKAIKPAAAKAPTKAAKSAKKAVAKAAKPVKAAVKRAVKAIKATVAKAAPKSGPKAADIKAVVKPSKTKPVAAPAPPKASAAASSKASAATEPKVSAPTATAPKAASAKATSPKPAAAPKPAAVRPAAVPPAVAAPAPAAAAATKAPVAEKRTRRPRLRLTSTGTAVAAWFAQPGEKPRPSSFIPAPPRAEAPSLVAAPPASSDRLVRKEDVDESAVRTVPVRVDIEQGGGRIYLGVNPLEVTLRVGEGIEWDFRYLGGADVSIDEVVIELDQPAPFPQSVFRSRRPGTARPHRQLSGAAQSAAAGQRVHYTIRAFDMFKTEMATTRVVVLVTP